MLVVTTTMGMLHRVHGHTTHLASEASVTKLQNNPHNIKESISGKSPIKHFHF